MGEMTKTLDEAFEYSAVWYLEKTDFGEDLTNEQGRNVDSFYALQKAVRKIPPALMQEASELAAKYSAVFQRSLESLLGSVSDQFRPATAAERIIVGGPRDQPGSKQPQQNIRTLIGRPPWHTAETGRHHS